MEWRPIETAPKDGTKILLAKIVGHPDHDTALWWACRGFWSNKWNNWNDGIEPSGLAGPTHWVPVNGRHVGENTSDAISQLTWVRQEVLGLCEATEDAMGGTPFERGREYEAKGIRRTMAEVIRERIDAITGENLTQQEKYDNNIKAIK